MRMKVWGEISGERHLVGTLETIPGREEQFSYAESYLENEAAQPLSALLPLREEPFRSGKRECSSAISFRKEAHLPLWRRRWK